VPVELVVQALEQVRRRIHGVVFLVVGSQAQVQLLAARLELERAREQVPVQEDNKTRSRP
jgi:hypothetical protein